MTRELVPEGRYVARAAGAPQWGKTSKGNEQLLLMFTVTEGGHAGQQVAWFAVFTKKTDTRILESLRYCGWRGSDLAQLGALDLDVEIDIEHNSYNPEKTYARVAWVNRIGGGIKLESPMSAAEVRGFAARMKSAAIAVPEEAAPPRASNASASPYAGDSAADEPEDDMPF